MAENKADLYNDNKAKYNKADIADDNGFVNQNTDSSVVSKSDGNNVMAAGKYAQIKMDKETGSIVTHSIQNKETAVIKELEAEMKQAAAALQFERAAQLRDQLMEYKVRL